MRVARAFVIVLVVLTGTAFAENSVDWSQYVEKPTDKPLVSHTPDVAPKEAPVTVASAGKTTKSTKKKASAKKSKARTTTKAHAKTKSRHK